MGGRRLMRVFVPATVPMLATLRAAGSLPVTAASAVDELRGALPSVTDADGIVDEELEYLAMRAAARASLDLLAADAQAPPRRVVIAADDVGDTVSLGQVASVHVDDDEATSDVAWAVGELRAAASSAEDQRYDLEPYELMWFAPQEIDDILAL